MKEFFVAEVIHIVGLNGFKYIELLFLLVNEPFFSLRINGLISEDGIVLEFLTLFSLVIL